MHMHLQFNWMVLFDVVMFQYYQALFRDGECFLHVVSLLNSDLDDKNGERLVLNVLRTLTCLLASNDTSKVLSSSPSYVFSSPFCFDYMLMACAVVVWKFFLKLSFGCFITVFLLKKHVSLRLYNAPMQQLHFIIYHHTGALVSKNFFFGGTWLWSFLYSLCTRSLRENLVTA